jgi:hypothetical protein
MRLYSVQEYDVIVDRAASTACQVMTVVEFERTNRNVTKWKMLAVACCRW